MVVFTLYFGPENTFRKGHSHTCPLCGSVWFCLDSECKHQEILDHPVSCHHAKETNHEG